jgi:hypothetical protein
MCDNCKYPPFSFRGDKHDSVACPFKTSQYCSWCAIYGHTSTACPAPPSKFYTEPCYVEQLLPASILKQYNITSKTLLPTATPPEATTGKTTGKTTTSGFIEITNDDKIIKAFLVSRGLIGPRTENSTLLRTALMNHAKSENKRLIFL